MSIDDLWLLKGITRFIARELDYLVLREVKLTDEVTATATIIDREMRQDRAAQFFAGHVDDRHSQGYDVTVAWKVGAIHVNWKLEVRLL